MSNKMQSYCDYNPKLFTQFTSVKTKINPTVADDWVIIPETYKSTEGFGLKSEKTNQYIQDINLRRFLRFCKEFNITITGDEIQGEFIVGSDRSVYHSYMYSEWKTRYDKKLEISDLVPGKTYKAKCGMDWVFLGIMYVSMDTSKAQRWTNNYAFNCTIPKKRYVVLDKTGHVHAHDVSKFTFIEELNNPQIDEQQINDAIAKASNMYSYIGYDKPSKDMSKQIVDISTTLDGRAFFDLAHFARTEYNGKTIYVGINDHLWNEGMSTNDAWVYSGTYGLARFGSFFIMNSEGKLGRLQFTTIPSGTVFKPVKIKIC